MLDDLKLVISAVQDLLPSWSLLAVFFLFTSAVLILGYLPLGNDKLSVMTDIKTITYIVWLFLLAAIAVKSTAAVIRNYRARKREREILRAALRFVMHLPSGEQALLKYVYSSPSGAVYLPYDNPSALSLWHQGALRRVVNTVFRRNGQGCFLYEMLPQLRELLRTHCLELDWSSPASSVDLDSLQ